MKIRITEPGWQGFTGLFGYTDFVDGVSVEDVSRADAQRLASTVQIEEADADGNGTGKNPSIAQVIIDTHGKPAAVETPVTGEATGGDANTAAPDSGKVYTEQELAEIADKNGIKGIRGVADRHGLKGTSIAELIGKILAKQEEDAAKAKAAEEAAAVAKAAEAKAIEQSIADSKAADAKAVAGPAAE